jgi:hypothetical protein
MPMYSNGILGTVLWRRSVALVQESKTLKNNKVHFIVIVPFNSDFIYVQNHLIKDVYIVEKRTI